MLGNGRLPPVARNHHLLRHYELDEVFQCRTKAFSTDRQVEVVKRPRLSSIPEVELVKIRTLPRNMKVGTGKTIDRLPGVVDRNHQVIVLHGFRRIETHGARTHSKVDPFRIELVGVGEIEKEARLRTCEADGDRIGLDLGPLNSEAHDRYAVRCSQRGDANTVADCPVENVGGISCEGTRLGIESRNTGDSRSGPAYAVNGKPGAPQLLRRESPLTGLTTKIVKSDTDVLQRLFHQSIDFCVRCEIVEVIVDGHA